MKRSRYITLTTFPVLTLALLGCQQSQPISNIFLSLESCHKDKRFTLMQCKSFLNQALTTHQNNDYYLPYNNMWGCESRFGGARCEWAYTHVNGTATLDIIAKPSISAFFVTRPLDRNGTYAAKPVYFNQINKEYEDLDGQKIVPESNIRRGGFWGGHGFGGLGG